MRFAKASASLRTLTARDVVLDVGSGSSPVPTFFYSAVGCKVIVTDLDVPSVQLQKLFIQSLAITAERFVVRAEDATKLSFADASVDFVSGVSMLEHIPGDGDIRTMREFCRVLIPGGRLVVTVPTSDHYVENASTFYYAGFERRYDPDSLRNRLCSPGLNCIEQLHMCAPDSPTAMRLQIELRPDFWRRTSYRFLV
jgi:ubiquinone/menaquinone biosynthesis C-methylase UbiE